MWRRERDLTGWMSLSRKPEVTWYGWDGDRLTTIQNDRTRIQTVYQPGSFTPLIRVETATGEQAKTQRRSLADALQQSGGEDGGSVVFPPVLVQMLDRLESEILRRKRSAAAWRMRFSSPAAKTVAVWCSRRCWCRCSTGWKVKSLLTG
ncbi:hypothetical protein BFD42_23290 [Escherichia coli]|nr:hypothetical protein BFD42_23290 [Escherichia coli]